MSFTRTRSLDQIADRVGDSQMAAILVPVVPVVIAAAAYSLVDARHNDYREQSIALGAAATNCGMLDQTPRQGDLPSVDSAGNQRVVVEMPVHGANTIQTGRADGPSVSLITQRFIAEYVQYDGVEADFPFPAVVSEKEDSPRYHDGHQDAELQLFTPSPPPEGHRVVDILLKADVMENGYSDSLLMFSRHCGRVAFDVLEDGSLANPQVVPTESAGELQLFINGSDHTPTLIGRDL